MKADRAKRLPKPRGSIFVISAPSGTGKTTLIKRLRSLVPGLAFSVSYTTRPPRAGEQHGREYFFVSRPEFKRRLAQKEFVEWAEIYGHLYGTSWRQLHLAQDAGQDVLLDIDVQGYKKLRYRVPGTVSVFLLPPSFLDLEKRLQRRHKDTPEVIAKRLATSRKEVARWKEYDYLIVNERRPEAVEFLRSIVVAARLRRECQAERVTQIYHTFVGG